MALKKKKGEDIHQLSDREIESELHDAREQLFRLRYSHVSVPLKNPLRIRYTRRRIAQMNTIKKIREKAKNN